MGFRYLMDVIPLDATLVKGSHGCISASPEFYPICITNQPLSKESIESVDVYDLIWNHLV